MVKHKHYEPEEVTRFKTDKTTITFLLSIAANKNINIDHYNIISAFTRGRRIGLLTVVILLLSLSMVFNKRNEVSMR